MCLTHIIGLVILCAVVAAAEDLVDVTMLTRNFVYGPRISPKLDCYVPPGVYARLSYSLGRPLRFSVGITRGPTNTIFNLTVPRRVSLHPRTTLYECAVNGSQISTVISPAMYYDRRDGPTFLPENFTVTANLNETATLRIQGAPGYNYVYPHVTSWAKVTFDRKEVSKTLATGNKTSLTIPRAGRGESGVYVARGPPHRRPGRNRAVIRLIVRSCKRGLWGKYCRNRCPDCKNGGLCHVGSGKCLCPPGFKGQLCEEACGDDHFGKDCTYRCSTTNADKNVTSCVGILMCLPDPYGCSCGTGFYGPFCNETCPPHRYGADCKQSRVCNCKTEPHCDVFTGTCRRDGGQCLRGWRNAPFCDASYLLLNNGPVVTGITDQEAEVRFHEWDPRLDRGMGTPRAYLVQYKEANGKWENQTVKALGKPNEYTTLLSGLRSNAAYEVRVLVVDQDGYYWEDDAKTTHFRTECGAPRQPPQDVNIDNSSTSEIVITWKNPAPEHWLCGNVSVVLEADGKLMELKATGGRNIYRIPVAPYTRVEVQLRLKTPNNKYSQWTPKQIATSAEDAPSVVRNVQLKKTGSREVLYTWEPPEHANGIIRHFMVVYTPLEFRISNCRKVKRIRKVVAVPSVLRSANLTGLHPYTKYNVSLSAVTVKPGPEHSTTLYTEATVPERAPENVKIGRTTGTSSSLTWSEVPCEFANGPNLFYYLELESRDLWDQKHRNRTTTVSSFTYNDLVPYTRYQVKVFAQNDAGRFPHFSPLDFITAPEAPLPPTLLKAERLLEDSVSLLWNAPYPPYGLLEHYQLKFFAAKERHNITEHVIAHTNCGREKGRTEQHCYVVNGLEPYEMYYFSLQAKNKGTAFSPYSVELEVKTKEAVPGPPINIRLLEDTEHSIEILWDSPRKKNGILRTYEVNCTLEHTFDHLPPEKWTARSATVNATEATSLHLRDLSPGSTYSVCVQASTGAGIGEAVCGNFSTKTAVPGVPGNLRSTEEAVDRLRIHWHAPTLKNGALTSYQVNSTLQHTFNDLDSESWASKSAVVNASKETSLYLTELPPGSTYRVCVQASTSAGFGKAVCGSFSTKPSVPDAPDNLMMLEETADSLKIRWDAPVQKNGALTNYQINTTLIHTFDHLSPEMWAQNVDTLNGSNVTSFYLSHLSPGSTYAVCVRASTSAGFGEALCKNFNTKVSVPDAPQNMRSLEETTDSLKIDWEAPTQKNGALTGYQVNTTLVHTFNDLEHEISVPASTVVNVSEGTPFYVKDLSPGSTYVVCVQAGTNAGFGDALCGNFSTKVSVPGAPQNIRSLEETTDSLKIDWEAPTRKNGALTGYQVNTTLVHTFNDLEHELSVPASAVVNVSEGTPFYVKDLSPGSTYVVCVQAGTNAGFGDALCGNYSTKVSVPGAPQNIRSLEETRDSLEIDWEAPTQKNGALTGYQVNTTLIHTFNDLEPELWVPASTVVNVSEGTPFCVKDLYPGSTYEVCVQAGTNAGFGDALCGNFSTKASVPGTPGNVQSEDVTEDSMIIQWDAPAQKNGALTGYLVNSTLTKTYNALQNELWPTVSVVINSSEATAFYLTNLSPGSTYLVCVQASTSAGVGEAICKNFSSAVSVPGAPEKLRSSTEAEHSLEIEWDSPSQKNGELRSYRGREFVEWSLTDTLNDVPVEALSPKSVVVDAYENNSCLLRDLYAGSTYFVCIQASTDTGFGEATCEDFSTNVAVPGSPENVRLEEVTEDSMKIQWDAPPQKNGALTRYLVNSTLSKTHNAPQDELWPTVSVVVNSSEETAFYLANLSPGSTYLVCVQASTSAGVGEAICKNFTTIVSVPGAPERLRSSKEAEHSLEIQWDSPSQRNGELRSYRVNSTLTHTFNDLPVEALSPKSVVVDAYENTSCVLRDLSAGSTYLVCIQASTDTGFGEATCENFSTNVAVPGAPERIRTAEKTEHSLTVVWDPPRQKNGALKSYKVNASLAHTFNDTLLDSWSPTSIVVNASDVQDITLQDLFPASTFLICVQASTIAGFGEAVCENLSTKASAPILQLEPIARASGNGKVSIVVNQVDFNKGPITGYYVLVVDEPCYISEPVKLVNFTSAQEMKLGYYVGAYFSPGQLNASSLNVVVGSGHMIGGFENPPLTDGVAYCFGLLVETNFSGEVLYGYSLAAPLIVNGARSLTDLVVATGAFLVFLLIVIVVAILTCCCVGRKSPAAKERDSPFEEAVEYGMSHVSTVHKTHSTDASNSTAIPNSSLLARPDLVRNLQVHKTGAKPVVEEVM